MNVKLITFILGSLLVSHIFGLFTSENIVFQKANEVFINDAQWSVTFVHDLRPFQNLISQIKSDLARTDETVKTKQNKQKKKKKLLQKVKLNRICRNILESTRRNRPLTNTSHFQLTVKVVKGH